MIIYTFSCGCVYNENSVGRLGRGPICTEHPDSKVVRKQSNCIVCNIQMDVNISGSMKKRCPKCQKEFTKAHDIERYKESVKATIYSSAAIPKRKNDCANYEKCLMTKNARLIKDPSACINCTEYVSKPLDILDYLYNYNYNGISICTEAFRHR